MSTWRLIPPLNVSGSIQMMIDRWLLEQHCLGLHPPTLRFYIWSQPTISLGYHQLHWPSDWKNLIWRGATVELVQRPTGGRAVLHHGDLTYAVITSGLIGNRQQTYEQLCQFLIQGWGSLGIHLHYGQAKRGYHHNPNCFGTATGADLLLEDGTKIIGSAQLHRNGAILQHGSMQLSPDPALFARVFGENALDDLDSQLLASLNNLNFETIIAALVEAARCCFKAEFEVNSLSEAEWQAILQVPALTPALQFDPRSPSTL
jgi:lipoate-protein ligase A